MKAFRNILILLHLMCYASSAFAQKNVEGIVSDSNTKQRISRVQIKNIRTNQAIYNNSKGEFSIFATVGDTLIASSREYFADTLVVSKTAIVLFHMKRESIYIDEVVVSAVKDPDEILKNTRLAYEKAYRLSDPGDLFSVGQSGAGLSINSIYSLFSREAKNAKRLKKVIESDYRENVIDFRFSEEIVSRITGLSGDELTKFRRIFRPSYFFIIANNQYELGNYIKESYKKYRKNPARYYLESLPTINYNLVP